MLPEDSAATGVVRPGKRPLVGGGTSSEQWINPIGGLGDTLMLSGVLKQVVERCHHRRFALVRRPGYMSLLKGHPAIARVGFPPAGAEVLSTDYWSREPLGGGRQRPMQILGRMFGLEGPIEERFCVAEDDSRDTLIDFIPWCSVNVVIAPGSASPRKQWSHANWETLCSRLRAENCFVIEVGNARQRHVRGAYSLLGLTEPKQVFVILRHAQLVVTVDCFLMHAAHHVGVPAVVLWGPTAPDVYGYQEQWHLYEENDCPKPDGCIGPGKVDAYHSSCPAGLKRCVDKITPDKVYETISSAVARKAS